MSETIDILHPERPKRIAVVASNPAVSGQTGWSIGFWWSELTHTYWQFVQHGYRVELFSPDGGKLEADSWSDPRDASGYSADDLISLGFINSPTHRALVEDSRPLTRLQATHSDYDAILFVGGQGPMYTFHDDSRVHRIAAEFFGAGKITAVLCHATCLLLRAKLGDRLLVQGRTWTGFANSEEQFADAFVNRRIQPFWIEEEARKLLDTNFVVASRFKAHAVRDGNLITGQQQFSGTAVARLMIEALGV